MVAIFFRLLINFVKRHRYLVIGIIILGIILLQTPFGKGLFGATPSLQTEKVMKKDIIESFTASGRLVASEKASLHFQTGGKVAWVGMKKGDTVWAGQILASLDVIELQARFRQAEQDFIAAKAEVEKVYDETGRKVDESFSEKIKRTAAEAKQNKAYDAMKIVEKQMQDAALVSPISGVVISVAVVAGENATALQAIEIVNLSSLVFEAQVDETDFPNVLQDQKVLITFDAYPKKVFEGNVKYIGSSTKELVSGGSAIPVEIILKTTKDKLIDGLSGEAEFVQSETADAIVVPRRVLAQERGKTFVFVFENNERVKREVTTGVQTERESQIVSGLSEGEVVIINDSNQRR